MIRKTAPFLGRGIGFPFRLNPATGGVVMSDGLGDDLNIGLSYISDKWVLREGGPGRGNAIAEAIAHLLLTKPGEHDTLPEFGSRLEYLLFEQNNEYSKMEFNTWATEAIKRWEKRVFMQLPQGIDWETTPYGIDEGEAQVMLRPQFIPTQVPGNLVAPFVSPLEARGQEYPCGEIDAEGHDWPSRYWGDHAYESQGLRMLRPRRSEALPQRSDDMFYEVGHGETWLLISFRVYGDIRFWWVVADAAVEDAAARGEDRDKMDTTGDPTPGTLLRLPSPAQVLMEIAA